ncbi:MAG: alpha-N-arabinofuranosidase, partial [Clostridia bacterium]|nr:alpha-N-arabinofuranosidase [Clostridia bacterium]
SLHYYTIPHDWNHKGPALGFSRDDYVNTLQNALNIDKVIARHSAIMDQYDPERRVGLVVDEWGTWYDVEPGTNPGFLYQQNTMRDAMVAGLTLNIFNKHCTRVHMANLAQLVNVLQSLILTEGPKTILTPTYYVFKLYMHHQENELLMSGLKAGPDRDGIPVVQASASIAPDGLIHVTLVNPCLDDAQELNIDLSGHRAESVSAEILTDAMDAHNTFETPERVHDEPFNEYTLTDKGVAVTLPPVSVTHLAIRLHE